MNALNRYNPKHFNAQNDCLYTNWTVDDGRIARCYILPYDFYGAASSDVTSTNFLYVLYCIIGRISRCDILPYDFYGETSRNVATDVTLQSWIRIPVNRNSAPLPVTSLLFSRGSIFLFLLNSSGDSRNIPRITGIPRNSGRN